MSQRAFNRRVNRALEKMDMTACARILIEQGENPPGDPYTMAVTMHKSRLERTAIDPRLRLESVEWLRARGFKRRGGIDLPPPGVLPE